LCFSSNSSFASSNFNNDGNFNPNIATPDIKQSVNAIGFERFANSRGGLIFLNCECTTPNKPLADKCFLDKDLNILCLISSKYPYNTKKVCEINYLEDTTGMPLMNWREPLWLFEQHPYSQQQNSTRI
jgi:hypothetical protein